MTDFYALKRYERKQIGWNWALLGGIVFSLCVWAAAIWIIYSRWMAVREVFGLVSMNHVHFSAASDRWATPRDTYEALDKEFHFDFDPCPLDGEQDGTASLFVAWQGKRVFCNPPYGPDLRKFLERAHEAELAVFLIPARTDTRWFHEIVLPHAKEIRFLKGRLKFGDSVKSAPFPSMVVVFESHPDCCQKCRPDACCQGGGCACQCHETQQESE